MGIIRRPDAAIGSALFGATRQAVLRLLLGHVDRRFYQQQIIRTLRLGAGGVQRELEQLARAGIITRTVEGRQTYFQANRECPIFEELRGLIRKTFGAPQILREALLPLEDRIRLALIYGSFAQGKERDESDIDLLLVGDEISMLDAASALAEAQRELGREVNPSIYSVEEFCRKLAKGHHFVSQVVQGAKIFLIGDDDELTRLAQIRLVAGAQAKSAGNRRPPRGRR